MTDRTNIAVTPDLDLLIAPHPQGIRLVLTGDPTQIDAPLSTGAVLAAIDAADPDAMRTYLRETSPAFVADLLRPAAVTPEELDAVPEADSPEDLAR